MTSETRDRTHGSTLDTAARRGLPWWQAILGAALLAAAVNLLVFAVGTAAGGSFVVPQPGGRPQTVGVGGVLGSSVVPLALGVGLAVLLARWWPAVLRVAQVVGGALGVLTAWGPVASDADTPTRVALAAMHVVAGLAAVAALEAIRRRRPS